MAEFRPEHSVISVALNSYFVLLIIRWYLSYLQHVKMKCSAVAELLELSRRVWQCHQIILGDLGME